MIIYVVCMFDRSTLLQRIVIGINDMPLSHGYSRIPFMCIYFTDRISPQDGLIAIA